MTSDSRSVYLITYSHLDCEKVKSREDFAELFVRACGEDIVKQWVRSCEKQSNGRIHYCLGIKLNRVHRWKIGKENVSKNRGVVVNFQTFHSNYYDAYLYVTKEDPDYVTSQDHPLLTNSPQAQKASCK